MKKLVFVTQTLDPDEPVLAQTIDLVRALADRVDRVAVVARRVTWSDAPENVSIETFDAGSKLTRSAAFERALVSSLGEADGVLVHMVPEFALLAALPTRVRRIPLVLWYTHWHAGRLLRLATRLVDGVLTVGRASFPLDSPKVRPVGHAIDVETFAPIPLPAHAGPTRLLALGRTARWKGLDTLLDALEICVRDGIEATVQIRGPSLTSDEVAHRLELATRVRRTSILEDRVEILEPVPRAELPGLYGGADVVVSPNEPRSGATFDKVVFEAAACARPVVSTNEAFAPLLGGLSLELLAPPGNPRRLAGVIGGVVRSGADERARVGNALRARVVREHSLEHWADATLRAIAELRSTRGG